MTGRRKLLLADDSPTTRKVISLTFADEGMEVVTAADGREALRLLEDERPPDIVLADAVMPGPDGYELCGRVKRDERLRHVPVVLLVGVFEPFNEAEARRVGADTVLTKPFQSIRDLVSKVGSLLGGEAKPEAEERAQEGHRELAEEVLTRGEAAPGEAARGAAAAGGDSPTGREETPFADLAADDEMIEATPADSFGVSAARPRDDADSFAEFEETDESAYRPREAGVVAASDVHVAQASEEPVARPFYPEADQARPFGGARLETPQASFSPAGSEEVARPAFAAHAAGAAAADDALLDLGQIEPPATAAAAEADEFILDLDDFDAPASETAARDQAGPLSLDDLDAAPADADAAFAEAAHGETAEAEAARTPFEFSSVPAEAEAHDPAVVREVVAQDVPPALSTPTAAPEFSDAAAAPSGRAREFIEPEVVPAAEPVPGTVEGAFTDGSVEGDVPKPPPFIPDAPAPPPPFAPAEPSTAGYAVGEARTGVEERPRAEQLSPETIEAIARRVVELMSDKVVREIAWEVVPDLAELLIKRRLDEERNR
ncbi:MAG TPA: response regulator [Pyrinomonadaceae bacterium]|nr:response regulator [Pyrinomonadaceae bacterium]